MTADDITQTVPKVTIYTFGYGGLKTFDELKALLDQHGITMLIDVRTSPKCRKWKSTDLTWAKNDLEAFLGSRYKHMVKLGGLGFQEADYNKWLEGAAESLNEVEQLSKTNIIAIACQEMHFGKCHRKYLVGKALEQRGYKVQHLGVK